MFKDWPLLIAILLAFIATFSIYQYMKTQQEQLRHQLKVELEKQRDILERDYQKKLNASRGYTGRGLRVVVAKKDIPAGDVITSEMVELKTVPSSVKAPMSAGSLDAVVGKMARADILAGEQVMLNRVISPKAQKSSIVSPGTRLITVQVEQLDLFRFLRPGDHVDIALMFQLPQSQVVTSGLYQDVIVRAINGRISYSSLYNKRKVSSKDNAVRKRVTEKKPGQGISVDPNKGTITFALPPKDAAILFMANKLGKIEIFLRSSFDPDKTRIPPITADTVLQYAMPQLAQQAAQAKLQQEQEKEEVQKEPVEEIKEPLPVKKIKVRRGGKIEWVEVGPGANNDNTQEEYEKDDQLDSQDEDAAAVEVKEGVANEA